MTSQLNTPKGRIGVGIAALVLALAAIWFLGIKPQQSKADELATDITAAQAALAEKQAALARPSAQVNIKASDLFRLSKALPDAGDGAGVLLDVNRLARQNGLQFVSITPSAAVVGSGVLQQPYGIVLEGRFGKVSRFLGQLRTLVGVEGKRLQVRGRVYSIDQVEMAKPAEDDFPNVRATVTVSSFTFSQPAPATGTETPDQTATDTTGGTVAAGVTP